MLALDFARLTSKSRWYAVFQEIGVASEGQRLVAVYEWKVTAKMIIYVSTLKGSDANMLGITNAMKP